MSDGIIAINKPEGVSSARAVARVKKALGVKKAGHTGTLDPFATGLLLCTINKATRISQFFLNGHKKYLARVCLGRETDTYDLTGKTVFHASSSTMNALKQQDIEHVVKSFKGIQEQTPPIFSALKHKGQPLYKLARQGKKITKPPRQIEIFSIIIKEMKLPYIDLDIFCSSGTYIRSIAFDIGKKLGCGAHLSMLCRTRSSTFSLENAIELVELETLDKSSAAQNIMPMSDCLRFLPDIKVGSLTAKKIRFGQKLFVNEVGTASLPEPEQPVRIVDSNNALLAIVQLNKSRQEYNYSCVFTG